MEQDEVREELPLAVRMRSAYNRTGFGMLAETGIASVTQNAMIVLAFIIICARLLPAVMPVVLRYGTLESFKHIDEVQQILLSSGAIGWLLTAMVLGTGIGMGIGLLLMKKIARSVYPIEKKTLSLAGFLALVPLAFLLWGIGVLLGNYASFFHTVTDSTEQLIERAGKNALPYYIYAVIGAPVMEELLFRKSLLDRLHPYGQWTAAAVSALLFGLAHGNSGQFFLAFLIGLLFAAVYMRTGRVYYTMILHALINLAATLPELLALYGADIETAMLIAIHVLFAAGIVIAVIRRREIRDLLTRTQDVDARVDTPRVSFCTPGIKLLRIYYLVMLIATDVLRILAAILSERSALPLIGLGSTVLAVVTIRLLPKLFKKKTEVQLPAEA